MRRQPAVERGLRLLEQREVLQPRLAGRLDGQRAGHVVERRRHRQHDGLLLQAMLRRRPCAIDVVPGLDQVPQVARRRLDRRDARHVGRGAPGQERRGAIDAGVAEPGLGRGDQPAGHRAAVVAGELADGVVARRRPRAGRWPRRQVVRAGQVEERRQQRRGRRSRRRRRAAARGRAGSSAGRRAAAVQVDVGQGAVGRAQVDADEIACHAHESVVRRSVCGSLDHVVLNGVARAMPARAAAATMRLARRCAERGLARLRLAD